MRAISRPSTRDSADKMAANSCSEGSLMTADVSGFAAAPEQPEPDRRKPWVRLGQLLDAGSMRPLHPVDSSGVLAVRGRIAGAPVVAYCTDATLSGGAMGTDGCRHIVE